jgi:hypothetical protein
MNLLFIGQLGIPESFFLPFLGKHGYNPTIINTGNGSFPETIEGTDILVDNLYEKSKLRLFFGGRFGLFTKATFYDLFRTNNKLATKVKQIIKEEGIDVIYGSWGSQGLPEFVLLQRFEAPTIYEFRCYPYNVFGFAEDIENFLNRSVIQGLTGRVFATQRMLDYVKKEFDVRHGRNIVFAECYPKKCFYRKRLPLLSENDGQPHLLFIGSDAYDILPQIKEIIRRQIHVHIFFTKGFPEIKDPRHEKFISTFEHFDHYKMLNGEFGTFMTQFDACLVTYNFWRASCLGRFYNSIPSRFSFALTGGIPIVMPKGYLVGCEEIIIKHQIGFAYTDYEDMRNKLNNEELMDYYRRNAAAKSEKFYLENNFQKIDTFLRQICYGKISKKKH